MPNLVEQTYKIEDARECALYAGEVKARVVAEGVTYQGRIIPRCTACRQSLARDDGTEIGVEATQLVVSGTVATLEEVEKSVADAAVALVDAHEEKRRRSRDERPVEPDPEVPVTDLPAEEVR